MRKFIGRAVLFVALCLLVCGGMFALVYHVERRAYLKEVKIPDGVSVVACGDSQFQRAFLEHDWPAVRNWCLSAIRLDQLELKVHGLLKENPEYHGTVVMDISPVKLTEYGFNTPLSAAGSAGKRMLLHVLYPERNRRPMGDMFRLYRDALVRRRMGKAISALLRGKRYRSSIGGEALDFIPAEKDRAHTSRGFLDAPAEMGKSIRGVRDKIVDAPIAATTNESVVIIRQMVADIKSHGCTPILVTTPFHRRLMDVLPPERIAAFRETMRVVSDELGVRWLDYLEFDIPDEGWGDCIHLNRQGGNLLERQLRKDLGHDL